ncbi:1830_t:CDS:2 [Racocetra fulgida]|uniref:1830_t:CDS:1 n=1 Tax=Racocetra fulgida TaxID=60492 RepID=A0A9N9EYQ5_9GLOM|nr:1830_t:CDS:2 [Racocetra fulgida]
MFDNMDTWEYLMNQINNNNKQQGYAATTQKAVERAFKANNILVMCRSVAIDNIVSGSLPQQPYLQQSWALLLQQVL